jgi:hypothetical protein
MAEFNPAEHMIELPGRGRNGPTLYLPVAARIAWFRAEHPDGIMAVHHIELTDQRAVFKARVGYPATHTEQAGDYLASAEGYGSETPGDFKDYIEKAGTKALGRALAALGYGTLQAGDELDEGARIVDTPQTKPTPRAGATPGREPAPRSSERPTDRPAAVPGAAGPPSQLTAEEKAEAAREMFGRLHTLSGMDKLADKLARDGVPRTLWGEAYDAALARLSKVEAVTA